MALKSENKAINDHENRIEKTVDYYLPDLDCDLPRKLLIKVLKK